MVVTVLIRLKNNLVYMRIKNKSLLLVKIVSIIEILWGGWGIILLASTLIKTGEINGVLLFIFLSGFTLFTFSIFAGKRLLQNQFDGYLYSFINLGLQLIQASIGDYKYSYSASPSVLIGVLDSKLSFSVAILPSFNMAINTSSQQFIIINLFPVAVFLLLLWCYKKYKVIKI